MFTALNRSVGFAFWRSARSIQPLTTIFCAFLHLLAPSGFSRRGQKAQASLCRRRREYRRQVVGSGVAPSPNPSAGHTILVSGYGALVFGVRQGALVDAVSVGSSLKFCCCLRPLRKLGLQESAGNVGLVPRLAAGFAAAALRLVRDSIHKSCHVKCVRF